jgi:hypothetical protein
VPPFSVIVLGITVHVINADGDEQPSCTVPVTPVPPEICSPKKAVPPGVVVAVVDPPDGTVTTIPVGELNVAVTAVAAVIVTVQVPVPSHGALHPVNVEPVAGVAVNVTCVPPAKFAEQVGIQLIPAGALVTVPAPLPASVTVSAKLVVPPPNVAVTAVAAVIVNVQVPVPSQLFAPLHPVNVDPAAGAAVNVTTVPPAKFAVHAAGQLIPAGTLVTVPVPVPASATVTAKLVAVPIVVVSLAVLLPVLGSGKSEVTVAELVIVPTASGTMLTIMVTVALPSFATVPKLQLKIKVPVQAAPCDGVADTKVDWLGNVFVTITFVASFGPAFVIVTV